MSEKICFNCMKKTEEKVCPYCGYDASEDKDEIFALKRGTILKGRYMVGKVLGQGGFGITYVGHDLLLDIKVAVKEYYPRGFASRNTTYSNDIQKNYSEKDGINWDMGKESFIKEARKMARLKNVPLVVGVEDAFYENETAYIVMDFVEGINLREYLKKNGVIEAEKCVERFLPLIRSLSYVHDRGIIHRDISPDNIMVKEDGSLCLLDLGAAKDITLNNGKSSQLVAKEGYSPIEQYTNAGDTGTWTDVYALCATILYAISGKRIPPATDRLYKDSFNILSWARFNTPGYIKEALKKGLEVMPKDRIQNMKELEAALCGKPEPEPEPVTPEPEPVTPEPEPVTPESEPDTPEPEPVKPEPPDNIETNDTKPDTPKPKRSMDKKKISSAVFLVFALAAAAVMGWFFYLNRPVNYKIEDTSAGTSTAVVSWVKNIEGIEIRPKYRGKEVTIIGEYAFGNNDELQKVILPYTISSIRYYAFYGCTSLTSIKFRDNLTAIGEFAFGDCSKLYSITLPKNLNWLGANAFNGCSSLISIFLPEKLEWLGENAFEGCSSLSSIALPDGIETVSAGAFEGCSSLASVNLPDNVKSIGKSAFKDCVSLKEITIPDSLEEVEAGAFENCGLETIYCSGTAIPTGDEGVYKLIVSDAVREIVSQCPNAEIVLQ